MCEAMGIVVRYVTSEWKVEQQLVRLQLLAQSMSGEEVAPQHSLYATVLTQPLSWLPCVIELL